MARNRSIASASSYAEKKTQRKRLIIENGGTGVRFYVRASGSVFP